MVRIAREGIPIRTLEDLSKIPDRTTRILNQYLLEQHPNQLDLTYEPHEFVLPNQEGLDRRTTPDTQATNRRLVRDGRQVFYIEATLAYRHEARKGQQDLGPENNPDFKLRQREVMEGEDFRYIVYYREHLERITRRFPQYNFFDIPNFKAHEGRNLGPSRKEAA